MTWAKGQSGNPGGRPAALGEIRDIARQHTNTALQVLVDIMGDRAAPPHARVGAATALLDRGWGRPAQTINASVEDRSLEIDEYLGCRAIELMAKIRAVDVLPESTENTREANADVPLQTVQ